MSNTIEDFTDFFHPDKKNLQFMPENPVDRAFKLFDTHLKNITIEMKVEKSVWLYSTQCYRQLQRQINTVFEPCFTTNRTDRNSGLGLYMAKILQEDSMREQLSVRNQDYSGCFEIILPRGDKND